MYRAKPSFIMGLLTRLMPGVLAEALLLRMRSEQMTRQAVLARARNPLLLALADAAVRQADSLPLSQQVAVINDRNHLFNDPKARKIVHRAFRGSWPRRMADVAYRRLRRGQSR